MNGNSIRDYLMWDREDREHPRLVVARALRSVPVEAVDSVCGRTEAWLRGLDTGYYDWVNDVLDADGGVAAAAVFRAGRGGWGIRLRRWRELPPLTGGTENHCAGWFTGNHN